MINPEPKDESFFCGFLLPSSKNSSKKSKRESLGNCGKRFSNFFAAIQLLSSRNIYYHGIKSSTISAKE